MGYGQFAAAYTGPRTKRSMVADVEGEYANYGLKLTRSNSRLVAKSTMRWEWEGAVYVRLHKTDILKLHANGYVTIDTGGWLTVTTKARLNAYLPDGWHVYSDKGAWYVRTPKGVYYHVDGATYTHAGLPLKPARHERAEGRSEKAARLIKRYIAKLKDEGWSDPAGDPWVMPDDEGLFNAADVFDWLETEYVHLRIVSEALIYSGVKKGNLGLWLGRAAANGGKGLDRLVLGKVRNYIKACLARGGGGMVAIA